MCNLLCCYPLAHSASIRQAQASTLAATVLLLFQLPLMFAITAQHRKLPGANLSCSSPAGFSQFGPPLINLCAIIIISTPSRTRSRGHSALGIAFLHFKQQQFNFFTAALKHPAKQRGILGEYICTQHTMGENTRTAMPGHRSCFSTRALLCVFWGNGSSAALFFKGMTPPGPHNSSHRCHQGARS